MRLVKYLLISFSLISVLGCGEHPDQDAPDKVNVQLKYSHQAQFAGIYVAIEKGYYDEENIDVHLIEGEKGMDLIAPVINGDAHFGIAASDLILAKRTENFPVKAIAAIYRRCAAIFVTHSDSDIKRPHEMIGKRIAVTSENAKEYEFQLRAIMKKLGLDITTTQLRPLDHQYYDFLSREVDVTGAYVTGGAMRLQAKGVKLNYIWPSDYGIDFYSDTIFVNESLIQNNKELVLRFLRATLKGWNEAIRNSAEAVDITMKYAKIKDIDLQTAMMDAQYHLIYTGEDHIGWMSKKVWTGMNEILFEEGVIDRPLEDISSVYTMEFLHSIYHEQ